MGMRATLVLGLLLGCSRSELAQPLVDAGSDDAERPCPARCEFNRDCCGGLCVAGACVDVCGVTGATCTSGPSCCSMRCQGGHCIAADAVCQDEGTACTAGSSCCGRSCYKGRCRKLSCADDTVGSPQLVTTVESNFAPQEMAAIDGLVFFGRFRGPSVSVVSQGGGTARRLSMASGPIRSASSRFAMLSSFPESSNTIWDYSVRRGLEAVYSVPGGTIPVEVDWLGGRWTWIDQRSNSLYVSTAGAPRLLSAGEVLSFGVASWGLAVVGRTATTDPYALGVVPLVGGSASFKATIGPLADGYSRVIVSDDAAVACGVGELLQMDSLAAVGRFAAPELRIGCSSLAVTSDYVAAGHFLVDGLWVGRRSGFDSLGLAPSARPAGSLLGLALDGSCLFVGVETDGFHAAIFRLRLPD